MNRSNENGGALREAPRDGEVFRKREKMNKHMTYQYFRKE